MATPIEGLLRPAPQPLWTGASSFGGPPRSTRGGICSPSPRSPKSLAEQFQVSLNQDGIMSPDERAVMERLDQQVLQPNNGEDASPSGSASALRLRSPTADPLRIRRYSLNSFCSDRTNPVLPSPVSPATAFPNRRTIAEETHYMLLDGMSGNVDRRQSAPSARSIREYRKAQNRLAIQLRGWGHVYHGDAESAEAFIGATHLSAYSDRGSTSPSGPSSPGEKPKTQDAKLPTSSRQEVKVLVVPRNLTKPFHLTRTFDVDEVRATVSEPLDESAASPGTRGLKTIRHARRHSSSAQPISSRRGPRSSSNDVRRKSAVQGSYAVPFHLEYARTRVPIVAAFMISGYVRDGDLIVIPMPHPKAWPGTVAHIYTGRGDVTDAIKENINYLGGRC